MASETAGIATSRAVRAGCVSVIDNGASEPTRRAMPTARPVDRRPAEAFVHDGPIAVLSARVAEILLSDAGLAAWAITHRGEDVEVDNALVALKRAAATRARRFRQVPSEVPVLRNLATSCRFLTVKQAAEVLSVSDRAVRKAISQQRLEATRAGSGWRIETDALAAFAQQRQRKAPA